MSPACRVMVGGQTPIGSCSEPGDQSMKPEDLSLTDLAQEACLEEFLDERVISPSTAAGVAAPTEQAEPIGFGHESPSFDVVDFADNCGETSGARTEGGRSASGELLGGWLEVAHTSSARCSRARSPVAPLSPSMKSRISTGVRSRSAGPGSRVGAQAAHPSVRRARSARRSRSRSGGRRPETGARTRSRRSEGPPSAAPDLRHRLSGVERAPGSVDVGRRGRSSDALAPSPQIH